MYYISCFADEISPELNEQVQFMNTNGIKFVEFRSVWDKNVSDLTDGEVETVKAQFSAAGIKVSSIGSPIGKIAITDDFNAHLLKFKRVAEIAKILEAPYIRIFSFYMKKDDYNSYEQTVIDRLKVMLQIAIQYGICLLHENEAGIYGESSLNCKKLFHGIESKQFRAVFDPSNFVAAGEDTLGSYQNMKAYIEYMHIKDSLRTTGEIVAAGKGDGRIKELLYELQGKDAMFLSLEPHLSYAGQFRGFTGSKLFKEDLEALKQMLDKLKTSYE